MVGLRSKKAQRMKLVSFVTAQGEASYGALREDGVVDLGRRLPAIDLRTALAELGMAGLAEVAAEAAAADHALSALSLLPPIPNPGKILCVGLNYKDHVAETGRETPTQPSLFARFPDSIRGHDAAIVRPRVSSHFDYEGELAMVIGRPGRHIPAARALEHVMGYTCFNDGSLRDYQRISVTSGKNFCASGACGPYLVTADEVGDAEKLMLTTRLNGQVVQQAGTDTLLFSLAEIIAFVSVWTPLAPGDVIATGTPSGVGSRRNPPLWMKAGDVVEVEITKLGTLRNVVVDEG
jgi:2-keto-4-pentenoate hydratase/2-oxohepta-3-ene-1,7-dioic acid hydratase in catechol pathway